MLVLSAALLAAFLLMTVQVREQSDVPVAIKQFLLTSVSPLITVTALVGHGVASVWYDYIDLRRVHRENRRLQAEVFALRRRIDALQEGAEETRRLRQLLHLQETLSEPVAAARVIGKDPTNWFRTLVIDKGSRHGIRRNMPVIAVDGLVGRVVDVTPHTAKIQLVTDPLSSVGILVERTRVTGILAGDLAAPARIKYLPLMADVAVEDRVITSGMGGVFPKGIPVGTIRAVERRNGALFEDATVRPAVDFSRLEEVLVLREPPPELRPPNPVEGARR